MKKLLPSIFCTIFALAMLSALFLLEYRPNNAQNLDAADDEAIIYDSTDYASHIQVTRIDVADDIRLQRGATFDLDPDVLPRNSSNRELEFTLSNNETVTVDNNGAITAIAAGYVRVRVRVVGEPVVSVVAVHVYHVAESIQVEENTVSVREDRTIELAAAVYPEDAVNYQIEWISSDENIATVDENGLVTPRRTGRVTITVRTVAEPIVYTEIAVTVTARPAPPPPAQTPPSQTPTRGRWTHCTCNCNHPGPTFIRGIMIVNHDFSLPRCFSPGNDATAMAAFRRMRDSARRDGHTLSILSGYRSYAQQRRIWDRRVAERGEYVTSLSTARPAHSEHQTGLAFDLNWINFGLSTRADGIWLANNAHRYGFILRYPHQPGTEIGSRHPITRIMYEPWHFRYVGVGAATRIFERGITLEEYLGLA